MFWRRQKKRCLTIEDVKEAGRDNRDAARRLDKLLDSFVPMLAPATEKKTRK